MASQVNRCWRCGVEWAPEEASPATLRVIPSGAGLDGGSFAAGVAAPLRAAAGTG